MNFKLKHNPFQLELSYEAPPPVLAIVKKVASAKDLKVADRFKAMAEKMQGDIDNKLDKSGTRLTNTPKRQKEAAYARMEGDRLVRVQSVLVALADLYSAGAVPSDLLGVKSKKSIYELVGTKHESGRGYYDAGCDTLEPRIDTAEARAVWKLLTPKSEEDIKAEELRVKIDGLQFSKIPGYFATPAPVIDIMLDYANIDILDKCLEPSAGSGAIVDRLLESSSEVHAFEINFTLAGILEETARDAMKKAAFTVTRGDFMEVEPTGDFNKVVMNPPFEKGQDIDHVRHAFKFLAKGGKLVSVMAPGAFHKSDKKSVAFREWFDSLGGESFALKDGSFKESGTSVNTLLVIIDKE
jgi:predicted RNA methylase